MPTVAVKSRTVPIRDPARHRPRPHPKNGQMTLSIREMTEADTDDVARLRVLGWRHAYRGIMPRPYLDDLDPLPFAAGLRRGLAGATARTGHLVASGPGEPGRIIGWACQGPYRPHEAGWGEVRALYVHPGFIGTGVGRALLEAATARLSADGLPRVRLWVVRGNMRALRFYERAGFAPDGAEQSEEIQGVSVAELRYARG
ncbi:acetyltransferase [Streptomyces xiamenensis]|uniref:Acetyltransferase n=2 Tax=Streptomyces TaxID=1883 RepID=A0A0F7CQC7_9ACTN|nr:acetyltransferase [Streptomyces xiamenensis]